MSERVTLFQEKVADHFGPTLMVTYDSDWDKGVSGGRCITDFKRDIKFSRDLSKEELATVKKILQEDPKCPGWTGVNGYEKEGIYRFSTTWDSSD